jgi:hypothetical protein
MIEGGATPRTVAHNVRAARTRAGLSLEELGGRAQVNKGALVALEKAQGNPDLPPSSGWPTPGILMQGPAEGRVRVVAVDTMAPLWTGGSGKRGPTHADHLGRAALSRSGAGNCTRTRPDSPPRSAAKPIVTGGWRVRPAAMRKSARTLAPTFRNCWARSRPRLPRAKSAYGTSRKPRAVIPKVAVSKPIRRWWRPFGWLRGATVSASSAAARCP